MTFADHFSDDARGYAASRPSYPQEIYEWIVDRCRNRDVAWDCATGNGQAATALSNWFAKVYATDASKTSLRPPHPNRTLNIALQTQLPVV